jgi:glycosyltransferase involved in cell wall biosynthesis
LWPGSNPQANSFFTSPNHQSWGTSVSLFQKAFPNETDVELHVKAFPDCSIYRINDPRVRVVQAYFSAEQLADWFAGLTCFVSAARGEGWGLMQHQALAVGRPLISVNFGGVGEYFTPDMGYSVAYSLVPSLGLYKDCGVWAEPDHDAIIEAMRQVYHSRSGAQKRGEFASQRVSALSWLNSNQTLLRVLRDLGFLA